MGATAASWRTHPKELWIGVLGLGIALGASLGGRPHHRIGDRYQDLKDMGGEVDNPAGV